MNAGVALADDIRPWFDWPSLPDGDGANSFMPINTQLLESALLALKQAKEAPPPQPSVAPAPGTSTGGSDQPTIPSKTRPAPNGNGKGMTREEAWHIVEAAVNQAKRMERAADTATRIGSADEG